MYECVILYRNTSNALVGFVGDDDQIAVFSDRDAAIDAAETIPVCRVFPWQIVELDEL